MEHKAIYVPNTQAADACFRFDQFEALLKIQDFERVMAPLLRGIVLALATVCLAHLPKLSSNS